MVQPAQPRLQAQQGQQVSSDRNFDFMYQHLLVSDTCIHHICPPTSAQIARHAPATNLAV